MHTTFFSLFIKKKRVMPESKTLKANRNLMQELNAVKTTERQLEQQCTTAGGSFIKREEIEKLQEVCKRKQQPTQINTQKKQKTQHYTNITNQSSNIDQDTNIECDTSSCSTNIHNIQQDENIDTSRATTSIHNVQLDENIHNAVTENELSPNEQQVETQQLQK